jgi:hypothetical protein
VVFRPECISTPLNPLHNLSGIPRDVKPAKKLLDDGKLLSRCWRQRNRQEKARYSRRILSSKKGKSSEYENHSPRLRKRPARSGVCVEKEGQLDSLSFVRAAGDILELRKVKENWHLDLSPESSPRLKKPEL